MIEASSFWEVDLTGLLNVLNSFLSSSNPDVLNECIEILNIYIKQRLLNGSRKEATDEEVDLLRTACCRMLPHWDSDDFRVLEGVTTYFRNIFELLFTTHRFPKPFVDWISSDIVEKCILESPYSMTEPVILPKGSIRLIGALMAHAPLSWIFERCPHLMTSLLLALAWNYCAASAGDIITKIILHCRGNVNDWLERVLDPLANFLVHGVLSCSVEQQLRGLSETDIYAAAKLRLENFILHCCKPPLASLPLGDLYHEPQNLPSEEAAPLVQAIVHQLALLLEMASPCTNCFSEFRLRIFVALLPLLPLNVAIQVAEAHSSLIEVALQHSSDRIRAEMCKSLAALIIKTPAAEAPQLAFYHWVLEGVAGLLSSADPTARNVAIHAFFEMTLNLCNRCSTCIVEETDALAISHWSSANGCSNVTKSVSDTTAVSHLQALGEVYHFATSLWSRYATTPDVSFEAHILDLTPFLKELLSQPVLPPGLPYQQQKMLGMLIRNMFKLSFLEAGKQKNLRRFGLEPCTTKNLQQVLNRIIKISGFPSLNERTTWMQLIASLPNVNTEIQTMLLEILTTYWSQTSSSDWLTSEVRSDLLRLAETWSNIHLPNVYSAGATLFQWMLTSVTDQNAANQLTSDLLANIQDLCRGVTASEEVSSETMVGRVVQRIMDKPSYGFLTAIDNIFSWFGNRPGVKTRFPQSMLENPQDLAASDRLGDLLSPRLAEYCLHLSSTCLTMIGCPCPYPDIEGPSLSHLIAGCETSSFEALGRAIIGLTLQAQKETAFCDDLDGSVGSTDPPIKLSSEYQHILLWNWTIIKLTSSILVKWVCFRVSLALLREEPPDEISKRYFLLIGKHLISILMTCRHKGVVEALQQSLQDYLTTSEYVNQHVSLRQTLIARRLGEKLVLPDEVIDICMLTVKRGKFSITRRAAGLWPATKAALMAELLASPSDQPLLHRWLRTMFELGSRPRDTAESIDPTKHDPPQALALHLIKGVFEDARLGPVAFASPPPPGSDDWFTAIVCQLALPNFTADEWTIANASLQLFGALMKRLIGPLHSRPKTTVAEVFGRYPSLFKAFLNTFLADLSGNLLARSAAVPLLSLLSRLSPSPNAAFSEESKEEMRNCLRRYLSHRVAKVRHLAGEAFVAFFTLAVTPSADSALLVVPGGLECIFRMNCSVDALSFPACNSNAISGQLFALEAWLRGALTSEEASERAKRINWLSAIKCINEWTRPESKHWYLAAQMAAVLRYVFMYIPTVEKSRYYEEFNYHCTYHQWRDSPNDLLYQSPFLVFHSAFYDLYHTVESFKSLSLESHNIFFTRPNNRMEENLLAYLLANIKCGMPPGLDEIVSGKALSLTLLRLALDDCVVACKSILLAIASPITRLNDTQARSKYTDWWVEHLNLCLFSEKVNEHSRLKASQALLVWLDSNNQTPVNDLSDPQLASIMRVLFCGLFDGSADVREVTGRAVARIFGLQHSVCPLYGANLLLSGLPSFLSRPVDWLVETLRFQLDSIVSRAEILHKCRSINVCFEPNEVNPYLDVQLVLNLLFTALKHYNTNTTELSEEAESVLENFREYITNEGSLRSVVLTFNSPGLYQASLAKRLALLPTLT
ncbi:Thyroid adenoma-associated protein [Taenia crassiceps]|uniref:Thyroid adenoma-associated protein n=1 Tax=Taenia crassiceps TaxID=6207 RepID=A0ABR4QDE3_9CEST